jgi:hypothetical protein
MTNWKSIRLELARTKEFPRGSVSRGYLLRLPLNDSDVIDPASFELSPHSATVRRYWSTEPDEAGMVIRLTDGWALRCDGKPDRLLEIDSRPIRLGQQLAVVDPDGATLPFKIASIR